jgi:hypothetical protein
LLEYLPESKEGERKSEDKAKGDGAEGGHGGPSMDSSIMEKPVTVRACEMRFLQA